MACADGLHGSCLAISMDRQGALQVIAEALQQIPERRLGDQIPFICAEMVVVRHERIGIHPDVLQNVGAFIELHQTMHTCFSSHTQSILMIFYRAYHEPMSIVLLVIFYPVVAL